MTLDAAAERVDAIPTSPPRGPSPEGARDFRSLTFVEQTVRSTFNRWGARLGATWILTLAVAAVFAPFIANSFPILAKVDGHWLSPMAAHFTPSDIVLLIAFFTGATLLALGKTSAKQNVLLVLALVAAALPLTLWPSAFYEGWRPVPEAMSPRSGNIVLAIVSIIDAAILVASLLYARLRTVGYVVVAVVLLALSALLIAVPVRPPLNIVYSQYRELTAGGKVEWQLTAPVPYSANDYQRDVQDARLQPPSRRHWLGTEQSGGDVFSRLLHATRIALSIGFIATGISVSIGVTVGGMMGYYAGWIDIIGMRLIEILEAVPTLILLLTVCAFFGRSLYLMMAVIGLLQWTSDARFVRAEFLRLRNQDFVQAAQAAGLPLRSIIFRHMLPNGITPVLVNSSFNVAGAILLESTLSFLGLGLVDEPSWGGLLDQARAGGTIIMWWIATFPGLAIFLTVFSYNLIGEALRDALDPKYLKRD